MAGRSSTTFQKRQKELARQEKQKDKAAKRAERNSEKDKTGPRNLDDDIDYSLAYHPDEEVLQAIDASLLDAKVLDPKLQ